MKVDSLDDPRTLLEALRERYGLDARGLAFLPGGEVAYGYRLDAGEGRFHVRRVEPGSPGFARVLDGFYLSLLGDLVSRDVYPRVPRVQRTLDGALCAGFGSDRLVVTEWIDGATLPGPGWLPVSVRAPLARALGEIHAGTARLGLDGAPAEAFAPPFVARLRASLDGIRDAPEDLRRLVGPRVSRIEREVAQLDRVRREVSDRRLPLVLCHADLHGGNLILDPEGGLWILDWEGAHLAPCEEDLAGVTNSHLPRPEFAAFLDAYEAARGSVVELDAGAFEFYFRSRCLEDLDDFLAKLCEPERDPQQRARELALLESECFDWLDRMEDDVRFVVDALQQRS